MPVSAAKALTFNRDWHFSRATVFYRKQKYSFHLIVIVLSVRHHKTNYLKVTKIQFLVTIAVPILLVSAGDLTRPLDKQLLQKDKLIYYPSQEHWWMLFITPIYTCARVLSKA